MVRFIEENIKKKRQKELLEKLDAISKQMIKGGEKSVQALNQLKEMLEESETFDLFGDINPRLISMIWVMNKFIHDLWANLGEDTRGFPKNGGMQVLQDIAQFLGIFIQTSLFRNRPNDSMGTLADVIDSYYKLLHLAEDAYKKQLPEKEYVVL